MMMLALKLLELWIISKMKVAKSESITQVLQSDAFLSTHKKCLNMITQSLFKIKAM